MAAIEQTDIVFRVKGAAANVNTNEFAIWTNLSISVPGSEQSTVNHWDLNDGGQPVGMTPEGDMLWRVLRQLLYYNEVLGVTFRGGVEPRHVHLRITPGGNTTAPGIPPDARDNLGEELLAAKYGEKYRLLEGLDVLADSLRAMTGMPAAPSIAPNHNKFVMFDDDNGEYGWTTNGDIVVRAVVRDIVNGLNQALHALRGGVA